VSLAWDPFAQCREVAGEKRDFKQKAATRAEEAKNRAEQQSEGVCLRVLSQFACGTHVVSVEIQADTILSNDTRELQSFRN